MHSYIVISKIIFRRAQLWVVESTSLETTTSTSARSASTPSSLKTSVSGAAKWNRTFLVHPEEQLKNKWFLLKFRKRTITWNNCQVFFCDDTYVQCKWFIVNAYWPFRNSIVYYVFQETIFEIRYNTILQSIKSVKSLWLILFTDYYHIKRACCIAKTVLKFDISLKLFGTSKQYLQKKYISNFDTFLNKATNFHDFQYAKFSIQYACA